jgi:hypothetical protein
LPVKWIAVLACLIGNLILPSCAQNAPADFHFTGDGDALLLQEDDVPPGWTTALVFETPYQDRTEWIRNYRVDSLRGARSDRFIGSFVAVLNQNQDAADYLEWYYQIQEEVAVDSLARLAAIGLAPTDFSPPAAYDYKSLIADRVKILYYPTGDLIGYEYIFFARYGLAALIKPGECQSTALVDKHGFGTPRGFIQCEGLNVFGAWLELSLRYGGQ